MRAVPLFILVRRSICSALPHWHIIAESNETFSDVFKNRFRLSAHHVILWEWCLVLWCWLGLIARCTPRLTRCNSTFISFYLFSALAFHFSYFSISSHFLTGTANVHVIIGRCQLRHSPLPRPLPSPAQSTSHYRLRVFILLTVSYIIGDLPYQFFVSLHLIHGSPKRGPPTCLKRPAAIFINYVLWYYTIMWTVRCTRYCYSHTCIPRSSPQ